jgi:hypothetical protein
MVATMLLLGRDSCNVTYQYLGDSNKIPQLKGGIQAVFKKAPDRSSLVIINMGTSAADIYRDAITVIWDYHDCAGDI